MSPLDRFLPTPRLHETDHVDLAIDDVGAWLALRHGDLSRLRFIRALLLLRSLPETLAGKDAGGRLRIDDLGSTPDAPGFQVLEEVDGRSIVVGAVGKPWEADAPFVHVDGADGFRAMSQPGYVRIVWALSVDPIGDGQSRISVDLSIDATSEDAWRAFRSYFLVVGPDWTHKAVDGGASWYDPQGRERFFIRFDDPGRGYEARVAVYDVDAPLL